MAKLPTTVALNDEAQKRLKGQSVLQDLPDYDGLTVDDLLAVGSKAASDAIVKAYQLDLARRGK